MVQTVNLVPDNDFQDDLARFCMEPDAAESNRLLAWTNAVCLAYVMVGIIGIRPPPLVINRKPPSQEEAAPVVIEPLVAAVPTVTADANSEQAPSERTSDQGAGVIAVVADSSAVAFSVPTVGNLVVPMSMAQAPPAHPMQGVVAINVPHILQITATGIGGSRPAPPYPQDSLMRREQGTVLLLIEVDESGKIISVTVKESSGYVHLDQTTAEYVRRHWFFESGKGQRLFESPIIFQLK
jgi:protein TonB